MAQPARPTPISTSAQAKQLLIFAYSTQQVLQATVGSHAPQTQQQQSTAIAQWAQQHWQEQQAQQQENPNTQIAVLVHPDTAETPSNAPHAARVWFVTDQTSGWLYSPLHAQHYAPLWQASSLSTLCNAARQAAQQGFDAADALVLGMTAVFAQDSQPLPAQALQQFDYVNRQNFPLLDHTPEHAPTHTALRPAFAPMPPNMLQAEHDYGLYAVMSDADWSIRCMHMGIQLVQLRIKSSKQQNSQIDAYIDAQIARCAPVAQQTGSLFFVNDHWQAALRLAPKTSGIDGVHLGQDDVITLSSQDLQRLRSSGLHLGLSSQTLWQLAYALHLQPSYIACGPVYATGTKTDIALPPVGLVNVRFWAKILHGLQDGLPSPAQATDLLRPLPLVVIGGITPERAYATTAAGANSAAVVGHITQADSPEQATADLQNAIAQGLKS